MRLVAAILLRNTPGRFVGRTWSVEWNGRKVLVTGGAGFLGSNLCHALAARGARVTALDGFLFGGGANPANLDGADGRTGARRYPRDRSAPAVRGRRR